ncbi:MAG: pyridoxal phosphate-dependent aminotransferase [Myxococcaceae bacterium]|nr:MAG: pyridoxal phosphate-dependent aminotransferase [Myxococcaceae bacterium]
MTLHNPALDDIPLSVFDDIEKRIAELKHPHFLRLHQGKSTFAPCARMHDWQHSDFALRAHEHAPPGGIPMLRRRIVEHLREQARQEVREEHVVITCGATHGIGSALRAMLQPGDEVLIMSPQWLFVTGLVRAAGGRPVEVPVFLELSRDRHFDFVAALEAAVTPRTRAIYFNTPNNPTGFSLDREAQERLARFARRHELWLISDNAYALYDFTEPGFLDISQLPDAADRTFCVHSFSKTYALPGYRVGFVVAPEAMALRMKKWGLYSLYSLASASQYGAFQALGTPPDVLEGHRARAREARDITMRELKVPCTRVEGGFYTFLDLSQWKHGSESEFLARAIQAGVSVAPGIAFGQRCRQFARLCFTAVGHEDLRIAIQRLNAVYTNAP